MRNLILTIVFLVGTSSLMAQDSQKQDDIRDLMNLTGAGDVGIQMMDQFIQLFSQSDTSIPEEFWTEFMKEVDIDGLVELIIPIYDKHYSHEEIKELIAFYKTPIGRKTIEVMPMISEESMMVGQAWGGEIGERVIKKLEEKGYK